MSAEERFYTIQLCVFEVVNLEPITSQHSSRCILPACQRLGWACMVTSMHALSHAHASHACPLPSHTCSPAHTHVYPLPMTTLYPQSHKHTSNACPQPCMPSSQPCTPPATHASSMWTEWQTVVKTLPSRNFVCGGKIYLWEISIVTSEETQ